MNNTTQNAGNPGNVLTLMPIPAQASGLELVSILNDRFRALTSTPTGSGATVNVGLHSARPTAATASAGSIYVETDPTRLAIYLSVAASGGASQWKLVGNFGSGMLAQLPGGLGAGDAGLTYLATDISPVTFQWNGTKWVYLSGTFVLTAAALVTLTHSGKLQAIHVGALFYTSDYGHESVWNGTSMSWGTNNQAPGQLVHFAFLPIQFWADCLAATVLVQTEAYGLVAAITVPNQAANPGAVLVDGTPYTPAVTAFTVASGSGATLETVIAPLYIRI